MVVVDEEVKVLGSEIFAEFDEEEMDVDGDVAPSDDDEEKEEGLDGDDDEEEDDADENEE